MSNSAIAMYALGLDQVETMIRVGVENVPS
jgi:hypothetical protein